MWKEGIKHIPDFSEIDIAVEICGRIKMAEQGKRKLWQKPEFLIKNFFVSFF